MAYRYNTHDEYYTVKISNYYQKIFLIKWLNVSNNSNSNFPEILTINILHLFIAQTFTWLQWYSSHFGRFHLEFSISAWFIFHFDYRPGHLSDIKIVPVLNSIAGFFDSSNHFYPPDFGKRTSCVLLFKFFFRSLF